jgi:general stress protein YciG
VQEKNRTGPRQCPAVAAAVRPADVTSGFFTRRATMMGKSRRGFAAMNQERQREIASKGGRAAHARGTAHEFTPQEAREAGRRGGVTVSQDRNHMAEIGRRGGLQSHGGRNAGAEQN